MDERLRGSLRLRLAVLFGVASLVLLTACAVYLHLRLESIFRDETDLELQRAAAVVAQRLDEDMEPPDRELLEVEDRILVRVTDRQGRVLIESDGMSQSVPADLFPSRTHQGVLINRYNRSNAPIRSLAKSYKDGDVLVARDLREEARLLRQFRKALALTILLGTGAAGFIGLVLARKGLKPLEAFAARAASIGPDNLHLRLEPGAQPSELRGLADALNQTIARLEDAFGRLSRLNADLAHELRTPLQALRLEMDSLAQEPRRADLEDRLGDMASTLDQVLALSEQMLFLAKAEDPATRIQKQPLMGESFLAEALAPFEAMAAESGVALVIQVEHTMTFLADPLLATRAVRNLASNALRHAPAGTKIFVSLDEEGQEHVLCVADEGPGMGPDLLLRVGHRFVRSDAARSKVLGGAGLGLAIVQGIMALHRGQLDLQSTPGIGTQARLRFPSI